MSMILEFAIQRDLLTREQYVYYRHQVVEDFKSIRLARHQGVCPAELRNDHRATRAFALLIRNMYYHGGRSPSDTLH